MKPRDACRYIAETQKGGLSHLFTPFSLYSVEKNATLAQKFQDSMVRAIKLGAMLTKGLEKTENFGLTKPAIDCIRELPTLISSIDCVLDRYEKNKQESNIPLFVALAKRAFSSDPFNPGSLNGRGFLVRLRQLHNKLGKLLLPAAVEHIDKTMDASFDNLLEDSLGANTDSLNRLKTEGYPGVGLRASLEVFFFMAGYTVDQVNRLRPALVLGEQIIRVADDQFEIVGVLRGKVRQNSIDSRNLLRRFAVTTRGTLPSALNHSQGIIQSLQRQLGTELEIFKGDKIFGQETEAVIEKIKDVANYYPELVRQRMGKLQEIS